jgi:hypothetical protein
MTLMSGSQVSWGGTLPRCDDLQCRRTRSLLRRFCQRRGGVHLHDQWYCAPQCFENAIARRFAQAHAKLAPPRLLLHRIPLGLVMLSRGQVNNRQLRQALEAQRNHGGRIGEWLEQLGYATEQQVTAALGLQWACPVLPVLKADNLNGLQLLPLRLLERFRMLPVHFVAQTRSLYLAFSERVDYAVLYAVEQMLEYRTEPCLVAHSAMDGALDCLGREHRSGELLFESCHGPKEMARIASSYVLKVGARNVRLVGCGEYIWVRIQAEAEVINLLFRDAPRPPDSQPLDLAAAS